MGTLRKTKLAMKANKDLRKLLVRGGHHEVLIDLDGDKEADIGLFDTNGDGDIDALGADLLDNGEFNLIIRDMDHNGIPDAVFFDQEGNGEFQTLAAGPEVEARFIEAAEKIAFILQAKEIIAEELDERLKQLDLRVREARKELNARR